MEVFGQQSERINVVYITDSNYVMPTCISIMSLIHNMMPEEKIRVFVICDGVQKSQKERLLLLGTENAEVRLVDVDGARYQDLARKCGYFSTIHVTASALFKFNLPDILPDIDKVIYLDGDTVVQRSVYSLYSYELKDNYVAAVNDMLGEGERGLPLAGQIGLEGQKYFNSGVMLLNLKKMREDTVTEKLLDYRQNGINYFMDQDALNAVLGSKRIHLPYIFNFMTTAVDTFEADELSERFFSKKMSGIKACIEAAVILHFTDAKKPWIYNVPWCSSIFFRYYEISPYANERIYLKSMVKSLLDETKKRCEDLKNQVESLQHLVEIKDYVVPYERIEKNCRLVLYGAGKVGKSYYNQLKLTRYCEIVLWADQRGRQAGADVSPLMDLSSQEFDYVLIAIRNRKAAWEAYDYITKRLGIDGSRVIGLD